MLVIVTLISHGKSDIIQYKISYITAKFITHSIDVKSVSYANLIVASTARTSLAIANKHQTLIAIPGTMILTLLKVTTTVGVGEN